MEFGQMVKNNERNDMFDIEEKMVYSQCYRGQKTIMRKCQVVRLSFSGCMWGGDWRWD